MCRSRIASKVAAIAMRWKIFKRKQTSDATGHVQLGYIVCLADFVSLVTYESDVYFRISPHVEIAPDENTR